MHLSSIPCGINYVEDSAKMTKHVAKNDNQCQHKVIA